MDWNTEMHDIKKDLGALRPAIADVSLAFGDLAGAATAPGALSTKTKELIAVAIGIAKQCDDCIGFHVKAALMAGATRDEISETIGMCVYMGGGPSLMYGAKALAAFDQFSAPKT
ncbi:MAG: carboxymuconolactone decarboxylase family protein [Rhodobacteraceae bacterium]|nr:carboxymuconolactone decarboxylase family protein [Paracoccaceae bacterium]